jgi:hypothetical protein
MLGLNDGPEFAIKPDFLITLEKRVIMAKSKDEQRRKIAALTAKFAEKESRQRYYSCNSGGCFRPHEGAIPV